MLVTTNEHTPHYMHPDVSVCHSHVILNCTTTDAPNYACADDSSEHPCEQTFGCKHHSYTDALRDGWVDHLHVSVDVPSEH